MGRAPLREATPEAVHEDGVLGVHVAAARQPRAQVPGRLSAEESDAVYLALAVD